MIRFPMILVLVFGFAACEQEGVTNPSKVGAPTRGGFESEGFDGGIGDVLPNITNTDVQPATVATDVQPAIATTDVLPATASPDSITSNTLVNNPCLGNVRDTCPYTSCDANQHSLTGLITCGTKDQPTCGFDTATNSCVKTIWCGDSAPSVGLNDSGDVTQIADTTRAPVLGGGGYWVDVPVQVHLMPKSSVCNGGKATFTPGTLKIWGKTVEGSSSSVDYGFRCVPNTQVFTVNC